jgi:hypothetical protein
MENKNCERKKMLNCGLPNYDINLSLLFVQHLGCTTIKLMTFFWFLSKYLIM